MQITQPQLSKWWKTPSAKAAFRRAAARKRERIAKLRAAIKAKQDKLRKEAEEYEPV
jgi:hypothetical protein